jgi:hypothetical protein
MLRRTSALVATVAALTAALNVAALPAQAHRPARSVAAPLAHRAPGPTSLPHGARPAITWQSGTTVHTAGRTVHLPLGRAGHGYRVLGKRGGEWLLAKPGYHAKVLAVKGSHVRTVWTHVYDESDTHYTLSRGASLVVEWNFDRSGFTKAVVFDLKGKLVAHHSWTSSVYLLDFAGDTLLVAGRKTARWVLPGKPVQVAPGASYGNLGSDLLFVDLPDDAVGPTSLATPGTPPWSATDWSPESVSDDGGFVAGLDFTRRLKLVVRKVSDGTLQPVPAFRADFDTPLAWEPDGSLLLVAKSSKGRAVVRCTMAGVCERATPFVKGQAVGFPA